MGTQPRRRLRLYVGVTAGIVAVLVSSCTRVIDDARPVAADDAGQLAAEGAAACTAVDVPLADVPPAPDGSSNSDPVLRIPKPPGWNRITSLDSERIRYVMRNDDLAVGRVAPTAVVTLESHRGEISPDTLFDEQRKQVSELGVTQLILNDTTLCGLPAMRGGYMSPLMGTAEPRPAEVLMGVMFYGDSTYGVAVTVQSADADDPTFIRDSTAILDGFQMLPPGSE
jgi:hypothetical protein